jgi:hypothetical protein
MQNFLCGDVSLHLLIESKVKFTRSTKEASLGEQPEEETAMLDQPFIEPELPASDSLPGVVAPIEP